MGVSDVYEREREENERKEKKAHKGERWERSNLESEIQKWETIVLVPDKTTEPGGLAAAARKICRGGDEGRDRECVGNRNAENVLVGRRRGRVQYCVWGGKDGRKADAAREG